jgi:hypothetical protein
MYPSCAMARFRPTTGLPPLGRGISELELLTDVGHDRSRAAAAPTGIPHRDVGEGGAISKVSHLSSVRRAIT